MERTVLASAAGTVQADFELSPSSGALLVTVEWQSPNGLHRTLGREVKPAAAPAPAS
jgi:hypothetical protein